MSYVFGIVLQSLDIVKNGMVMVVIFTGLYNMMREIDMKVFLYNNFRIYVMREVQGIVGVQRRVFNLDMEFRGGGIQTKRYLIFVFRQERYKEFYIRVDQSSRFFKLFSNWVLSFVQIFVNSNFV